MVTFLFIVFILVGKLLLHFKIFSSSSSHATRCQPSSSCILVLRGVRKIDFKVAISRSSCLRTTKMDAPLIHMRVLSRIWGSLAGYSRTSLSHQPTRTTETQEAITTKMMTIRYTVLKIATAEPLFSVEYPRVPVYC